MNLLKKLAGVAAFIVALGAAILVTKYYGPHPPASPPAPPAPPTASVPQPPAAPPARETTEEANGLSYKASLVSVDFAAKKTYTTLVLEREPGQRAPERVWVWTYFFVPGSASSESWSGEPVEIKEPFAGGKSRVTLTAESPCDWCDSGGVSKEGLYARVKVSNVSRELARVPQENVDLEITTATPVVIQHGKRPAR
ncbi:MAG TPA: hypothetical protein VNA19_01320 [Pyrinomonadaceae bacterium]|jgi:hypothetical protein|nr:hypothetical protein [Pyrinomonadaceae bacterium]